MRRGRGGGDIASETLLTSRCREPPARHAAARDLARAWATGCAALEVLDEIFTLEPGHFTGGSSNLLL
jgi:hypothetical protein